MENKKSRTYASAARRGMKVLEVYKKEFEPVIRIYAQLRVQYDVYTEMLEDSEFQYSEETQSGSKKHPLITTLESLRKDILAYASQLCLTPHGLSKIQDAAFAKTKKKSGLVSILEELDAG